MKRFILLPLLLMSLITLNSYGFNPQHHKTFIKSMLAYANNANEKISQQRQQLLSIAHGFKHSHQLTSQQKNWLLTLAKNYKIKHPDFTQDSTWLSLKKRVDVVPPSLVIAQAANESGWGTSRFATKGYNYFGQWCYRPGCGLVPRHRSQGQHHEVKRFASPEKSISAYINNLNTNHAYQQLRNIRYQQRRQQQAPTGFTMATGLVHYSSRGQQYVTSIQQLIKRYHLDQYDFS